LRIGMMLRTAPQLVNVWRRPLGKGPVGGNRNFVASLPESNVLALFDAPTGRPLGRGSMSGPALVHEFSTDGKTLLTLEDPLGQFLVPELYESRALRLWSLPDLRPLTGEVEIRPCPDPVTLAPDGRRVVMMRNGRVVIRDLISGAEAVSPSRFSNVRACDM